jgi:hypothetical protein
VGDGVEGLREHAVQRARSDHPVQRRATAGRVDLVDGERVRARGGAARRRLDDVCRDAVPEPALRARPRERRGGEVELRAPLHPRGAGGELLRTDQSRRGVRRRARLLQHARQPGDRRRRGHRARGVARDGRRDRARRDDDHGAARREGEGDRREQRRGVRRARLADRARRGDGADRLARVRHGPGPRRPDRPRVPPLLREGPGDGPRRLLVAPRRLAARRRDGVGVDLVRPGARPDLLRHRERRPVEPGAAPRGQQVGGDALRPRPRRRAGAVGLPDLAARPQRLRRGQRERPPRPPARRRGRGAAEGAPPRRAQRLHVRHRPRERRGRTPPTRSPTAPSRAASTRGAARRSRTRRSGSGRGR